jgi:hypothetical protein
VSEIDHPAIHQYVDNVYSKLNSGTVIRLYIVEGMPTTQILAKLWEEGILKVDHTYSERLHDDQRRLYWRS